VIFCPDIYENAAVQWHLNRRAGLIRRLPVFLSDLCAACVSFLSSHDALLIIFRRERDDSRFASGGIPENGMIDISGFIGKLRVAQLNIYYEFKLSSELLFLARSPCSLCNIRLPIRACARNVRVVSILRAREGEGYRVISRLTEFTLNTREDAAARENVGISSAAGNCSLSCTYANGAAREAPRHRRGGQIAGPREIKTSFRSYS